MVKLYKIKDLTGQKFGRLTVIKRVENIGKMSAWLCKCDCGNLTTVVISALKTGHTKSCGCLHREKTAQLNKSHGMTNAKIYRKWRSMLNRCYNENSEDFDRYGGRGIKVCQRWHDFQNFYSDVSQMEHFNEPGYSLDRIDNDGDYCPENCRFATRAEQNRNKRNNVWVEFEGEKLCLKDAAKKSGVSYKTLWNRYKSGTRGDDLFNPVEKRNNEHDTN